MDIEKDDAIVEAEITINTYRLSQYANALENRERIQQRKNGILDATVEFRVASFDILTQAALARLMHLYNKDHPDIIISDILILIGVGYVLGKEIKEKDND